MGEPDMKIVGIIIGLFLMMGACSAVFGSGSTSSSSTTTQAARTQAAGTAADPAAAPATPTTPPIQVNLSDIGRDYHNNKVMAQNKWDGQYVQFTGTVLNISDGWSPSVSFNLPPDLISQIVCEVNDEQELAKPGLISGGRATVRGTMQGDQTMGVVRMKGCEIIG